VTAKALRIGIPAAISGTLWLGLTGDFGSRARLVSFDEFPDDDPACARPQSGSAADSLSAAELPLRALLMQVRLPGDWNPRDASQRKPDRMIRDPYAAYSAVAVDANHDEVVMTDENLFNIWVYDRKQRTSPNQPTEPKRLIGGLNTKIEFQCGLYIDPANGDIYAVNNDTIDTLVIFSRQAVGDVKPDRELHTPHGTFGIAVDEAKQELFLTVQHDNAIVVYDKSAKGTDAPLRVIQGDDTQLADPHGMSLDAKRGLLYVTNHGSTHRVSENLFGEFDAEGRGETQGKGRRRGEAPGFPLSRDNAVPGSGKIGPPSITVYAKDARGNARPQRIIEGPATQMNWPTGIVVDEERNLIYVANDGGNSVLVFDATASGNAAPIRVLKGPASLVSSPTGISLDKKNNELWVANFGNHTSAVYDPDATGDAAPIRVVRSAPPNQSVPGLGNPHPIAYDTKREQILVPN
jgi:DNA-binding beta-propeller fold protein YncE